MISPNWVLLMVLASLGTMVLADVFISIHDMQVLAHQEEHLLSALQKYIHAQQAKLTLLTQRFKQLSKTHPLGADVDQYIGDPLSAFTLVRRLAREWPLILNLIVEHYDVSEDLLPLPTENDLQSALRALARLQEVYRLDPEQLSNGHQPGLWKDKMTASDCFDMGRYWYKNKAFEEAALWFEQTLEKIEEGDITARQDQLLAHLYLAKTFSGCLSGGRTMATNNVLQQLIAEHPDFVLSGELTHHFRQAMARNCSWIHENQDQYFGDQGLSTRTDDGYLDIHSDLCSGNGKKASLRCYYVDYDNPRLLVAPFKMEELHVDPPLVLFHDVISDQEIEDMKNSYLQVRTSCETVREDQAHKSLYRTCDMGWVYDSDSETSARLTRRMADISNLSVLESEPNQVASYGLGGEFMLHNDPLQNNSLSAENRHGNRIATLMFYLNDVDSGGRTIFPDLLVAVTPRKGSAVFWYNLDKLGEELPAMLHAGCPVLLGSKWVINKWFHEGGQDPYVTCPANHDFPRKQFYLSRSNK